MIPGLGRSPGGGEWQPTVVFLPGKFHGQRNGLLGHNPQVLKRCYTTEQLKLCYNQSKARELPINLTTQMDKEEMDIEKMDKFFGRERSSLEEFFDTSLRNTATT